MLKKAAMIMALCVLSIMGRPVSSDEDVKGSAEVRAYFMGYEKDDLIFRIFNEGSAAISVKGLAFNHQVLYRPVGKDTMVPVSNEEKPFNDMIFRTTGDFIWSENHMEMFELAYQWQDTKERKYGKIHPRLSSMVSEKRAGQRNTAVI